MVEAGAREWLIFRFVDFLKQGASAGSTFFFPLFSTAKPCVLAIPPSLYLNISRSRIPAKIGKNIPNPDLFRQEN